MKQAEIQAKVKEGWLRVRTIHEIAGFPLEHVSKTLDLLSKKIEETNNLEIVNKKENKPKKVGEKMWSAFIEVEFVISSASELMNFIMDFLPSSAEILEPEEVTQNITELTDSFNDLIAKLHGYNQAMSQLSAENVLLKKALQPHLKQQKVK